MARYKNYSKKLKLGKQGRRTKWAPFWIVPKALGKGKHVHPARFTRVKRSWRRSNIAKSIPITKKARKFRHINKKSGKIRRKY